jgi:protein-L-isoaspartate(D-aspartate) O-methyltransferase
MNTRFLDRILIILQIIILTLIPGCKPGGIIQVEDISPTMTPESTIEVNDPYQEDRLQMVENQIYKRGLTDPEVILVMETVPRHEFVPSEYLSLAYNDHPLPIGYGQTISQPYIVALMTSSLQIEAGDKVLEIGTGSGYQAAVLAELDTEIFTIEIIPELAKSAQERLMGLGYTNIEVINADGYYGLESEAPFDAIIVTAAPDHLPQPLIQQMADGGRMIIPIGPIGAVQTLWLFEFIDGELMALNLGPVTFVPLTGEHDQTMP